MHIDIDIYIYISHIHTYIHVPRVLEITELCAATKS